MNPSFERYKLIRFIRSNGTTYTFVERGKNSFNEPTEKVRSKKVKGVYHETLISNYITSTATGGYNIKDKPRSQIMCLLEDSVGLKEGMEVSIHNKDYKIVDLRDVGNFGVACDISLELKLK